MPLFSLLHWSFLAALIAASILTIRFRHYPLDSKQHFYFRRTLFVILIFVEITWTLYRHIYLDVPIKYNLPLHLCDFAFIICMLGLAYPSNKLLAHLSYYLGVSGSLLAMLFPDISEEGTIRYVAILRYFTTHFGIFCIGLYLTFGRSYFPKFEACIQSFFVFVLYMGFAAAINWTLGTNYMYLSQRPDSTEFLKALSQPVYVFASTIFGLAFITALHIPFVVIKALAVTTPNSSICNKN